MHVCEECGTIYEEICECCGQQVTPLEEALNIQDGLFELTENDRAQSVLRMLKATAEAAAGDVVKAEKKLIELRARKDVAFNVLMDFYKLTKEGNADSATGKKAKAS